MKLTLALIAAATLLTGCSNSEKVDNSAVTYCYQNTFGSDEKKDIELLSLRLEGIKVTGEYHWLPAFKDRRLGSFAGEVISEVVGNNNATVEYHFSQEGSQMSARLNLVYNEASISIDGGEPSLGLSRTLARIDCTQASSVNNESQH